MKRYKSSDLSNNRSEVLDEAKKSGVIIEIRKTNGKIDSELMMIPNVEANEIRMCKHCKYFDGDGLGFCAYDKVAWKCSPIQLSCDKFSGRDSND